MSGIKYYGEAFAATHLILMLLKLGLNIVTEILKVEEEIKEAKIMVVCRTRMRLRKFPQEALLVASRNVLAPHRTSGRRGRSTMFRDQTNFL